MFDRDVLIVGGGMVGSALACALGRAGFSVALLDATLPETEWDRDEVDLRVSALTRASQQLLTRLGAWQRMAALRVSPYREMHVWDAGGASIHFDSAEIGEPDLGHIVENRVTRLALWQELQGLEQVELLCPAVLDDFDLGGAGVQVRLDGGRSLSARLLVGADGGRSRVRSLAGIAVRGWAYDQHALVATIRPQRHHQDTAWQRFMATGPLAFLPIEDGRCSIVWSTRPEHAESLLALPDDEFLTALGDASERVLGEILEVGPRACFPLRLQHAESYVKPGLALIGDAAHSIHPLAGQGVNLGFLDAAQLADSLIQARAAGRDIGSLACLRRFERARKGDNIAMLAAMDGFKRLFGNRNPGLRLVRNLGLGLTDRAGPLKRLIMQRALGRIGELPALARPRI